MVEQWNDGVMEWWNDGMVEEPTKGVKEHENVFEIDHVLHG